MEQKVNIAASGARNKGRGQGAGSAASREALRRDEVRLLNALAEAEAYAAEDPTEDRMLIVRVRRNGVSVGAGRFGAALAQELVRRDLATWSKDSAGRSRLEISQPGRSHLRRRAETADEGFLAQHIETAVAEVETGTTRVCVTVDADESPLDWLWRRKGRDGEPLIDDVSYQAGERLRRDLTLAGLLPSVTMSWNAAGGGVPRGSGRDPASATDTAIAARQRVTHALEAVGQDFADLLVDLCGFLKGLELIEKERGWPPRSAKVVVRLALARLAHHYGLAAAATGPAASRGIRSWQAVMVAQERRA